MRNYTLKAFMLLLTLTGCFACNALLNAQTFSHPSTGLVVTGDVLDAASGSDFIAVVYNRSGSVYYNRLLSSGTWTGEELLGEGTEAKIALDGTGNPHVVFTSSGKIAYTTHNGTEWTTTVYIESNNSGTCSKPDIAVDSDGFVHLTYTDTMGNTHWYQNKPDIMYAENSTGSFVKQLIFDGYYENLGGADYVGDYFNKGSKIVVDVAGNYFITAHKYQYVKNMTYIDRYYSIVVSSNLGTGGTTASSTDIYDLYDVAVDNSIVYALYKQSTFKLSELSASGGVVSFINTSDITATSVSSVAANADDVVATGVSGGKLLTRHNYLSHTYTDVTVKGTVVSAAEVAGVFYSIYTDNADGRIKVREVAEPLSITSFGFAEQTGPAFIDGQAGTVSIEVANGSNLSNLTATYLTTSDATVVLVGGTTQSSGITANNFGSPVTYRLTNGIVARDWLITVSEEPMMYTVSTTADPVSGGTTIGGGDYEEGTATTVKARAGEGYGFMHWMEGETIVSTDTAYTFTVSADRNLKAVFIRQYTLTITTAGSGTVEVDDTEYTGVITANGGTVMNLEAFAGARYHFTGWSGDVTGTTNPVEITLDSNIAITATFAIDQYTLTIATVGSGSVEVDDTEYTGVITANSGTVLNLEAIAGTQNHFTGWSGDVTGTTNPVEITLDSNIAITATFAIDQYTLTITTVGSGSVEVDDTEYTGVITANSGSVLTLEAIAADGFQFAGWSGDLTSTVSTASLTLDGNKTITASFTAVTGLNAYDEQCLVVYPNPVIGEVNLSSDEQPTRACLYSLSGQQVMDVMLNGNRSFDISMLSSGLYLLTVEFESGKRLTGKIRKQ